MAKQTNGNVTLCPECEGPVKLGGKPQIGQKLSCRRCGSTLVVFDKKPIELVLENERYSSAVRRKSDKNRDKNSNTLSSTEIKSEHEENPQMTTMSLVMQADCPECNAKLRFNKPLRERQLVVCPECDETLEVSSLRPPQLNWANEDPWDYEEYDDPRHRSRGS